MCGTWDRKHSGYCVVKVFNFQYTLQEGTRLRGIHAVLKKMRMYEGGTVEHDPPVGRLQPRCGPLGQSGAVSNHTACECSNHYIVYEGL